MSQFRPILEALSRDELVQIADSHDLRVEDRRRRAMLVDAIAAAEVSLGEVLPGFSRDRLKKICRELGLDDSGREKASIVSRIISMLREAPIPGPRHEAPIPGPSPASGEGRGRREERQEVLAFAPSPTIRRIKPAEEILLPIADKLTTERLEK